MARDRWEVYDGEHEQGPMDEERVLELIDEGLPETAMVRRAGEEKWRGLRTHAPFAAALEAGEEEPAPAAPPPAAKHVSTPVVLVAIGAALVGGAIWGWQVMKPPESSPGMPAPPPPALATVPTRVPAGTWAKIPAPGVDIPNTPATRLKYMSQVFEVVPGEPLMDERGAAVLMGKLRAEFARQTGIPLASIKVVMKDGSASIVVDSGVKATAKTKEGRRREFPACSEAFLAMSMVTEDTLPEKFVAVGMRGLLCMSDDCVAVVDMRPTNSSSGFYSGEACVSIQELAQAVRATEAK